MTASRKGRMVGGVSTVTDAQDRLSGALVSTDGRAQYGPARWSRRTAAVGALLRAGMWTDRSDGTIRGRSGGLTSDF